MHFSFGYSTNQFWRQRVRAQRRLAQQSEHYHCTDQKRISWIWLTMSALYSRSKDLTRSRKTQPETPPCAPSPTSKTFRVSKPLSFTGVLWYSKKVTVNVQQINHWLVKEPWNICHTWSLSKLCSIYGYGELNSCILLVYLDVSDNLDWLCSRKDPRWIKNMLPAFPTILNNDCLQPAHDLILSNGLNC